MFTAGIGILVYLVYGGMLGAGGVLLLLSAIGREMFPPTWISATVGGLLVLVPVLLFVIALATAS